MLIAGAKYGHTDLIAKDWRALARFYEEQFGRCAGSARGGTGG